MEVGNGMKVVSVTGSNYTILCYGCSELFEVSKQASVAHCPQGCLGVASVDGLVDEYEARMSDRTLAYTPGRGFCYVRDA